MKNVTAWQRLFFYETRGQTAVFQKN